MPPDMLGQPCPHCPDNPATCVPFPALVVPDFDGTAVGLVAGYNYSSKYYKVGS